MTLALAYDVITFSDLTYRSLIQKIIISTVQTKIYENSSSYITFRL